MSRRRDATSDDWAIFSALVIGTAALIILGFSF